MATCPVPTSNDMLPESPGDSINAAIQQVLSTSGTQKEGQSVSYTEYLSSQHPGENQDEGCNTGTTSQSGSGSTTPSIPSYGDDIAAEIESSPSTPRPGLTSTPRNPNCQAQRIAESDISSIQSRNLMPTGLSRRTSFDTASNVSILSFDQSTTDATQTDTLIIHDEIEVPVLSYEIMEAQAKFTVFKLQVKKSEEEKWFIFRRYTDFVRLNKKLRCLFPHFRLALPPKKWFGNNYDSTFLEDRMLGLQAFLNNIVGHRDVCNSEPVRQFLCFDDPPGPHESLEESRAMCENLEDYSYNLRRELQERDAKIALMEEELALQRAEIDSLHTSLRLERSFHARRSSPGSQHSESSLPEQDQIPDEDISSHHDCRQTTMSHSPDNHCSTLNPACTPPGSAPTISVSSPLMGEQDTAARN